MNKDRIWAIIGISVLLSAAFLSTGFVSSPFAMAEFPLLIAFNTPTIWDVIRFWFMLFVFGVVWVALPVILLFFLVRWTIRKLYPKAFVRKPSKEELAREEWLAKIRKQHESQQEQRGEGQE